VVLEWERASAFAETTTGEDDAARGKAAGVAGVDLLSFTVVDMSCCVLETGVECWEEMEGVVNAVAESVLERIRIAAVKSNRPALGTLRDAGGIKSACSCFCWWRESLLVRVILLIKLIYVAVVTAK